MQPRKLLRRTSPKAGKKRAQLANSVTRKFGLFFRNSAGIIDARELDKMQTRCTAGGGDYIPDFDFGNP